MLIPPPWAPETASLNKDKTAGSLHENSAKFYELRTIVSTSKHLANSLMMVLREVNRCCLTGYHMSKYSEQLHVQLALSCYKLKLN